MPQPLQNGAIETPGKVGRPKSDRDDKTVKLERLVVIRAQAIAKAKGIPTAAYLSDLVRTKVAHDFAQYMRDLDESEG